MNKNFFENDCIVANEIECKKFRKFIEPISNEIFKKEKDTEKKVERKRTFSFIPSVNNLKVEKVGNKKYYYYYTDTFFDVIAGDVLLEAAIKFPECFNTNNSETIIIALNKAKGGLIESLTDEILYKEERYCYVIEEDGNGQINKNQILKLQLFKLQQDSVEKNKKDFTGGLFHAFKHFSFNGVCISTGSEKNLDYHPSYFVKEIATAFFSCELQFRKNPKTCKGEYYCNNNSILFAFYKLLLDDQDNLNVYFLNTVHKQ